MVNSTPLIYLARAGALRLLWGLYGGVVAPRAVYVEVVERSLEKGFRDAEAVKAAVEEGYIRVEEADEGLAAGILERAPMLHRGEAEAIALALSVGQCHLIVDDRAARNVAEAMGLEVHGTLYVLAASAARGLLQAGEALAILDRLVMSDFRISVELYLRVKELLLRLAAEKNPGRGALRESRK